MGEAFGRYELVRKLAAGGMGEVHLARVEGAAGFEKRVVIKKILRPFSSDPKFVERFIDEGKTLVTLTHGNIVPVFDLGVVEGEYYLAMEFVDGPDLREILRLLGERDERFPWDLATYVAAEVCQALAYAHTRVDEEGHPLAIVHRDISPSNILVSRDGDVKLVDFGIARSARNLQQTISGFIEGKVYYMSPEQARGDPLDHRTDLFSLGVVLYELVTGRRPYDGENELQVLERIKTFDPPLAHTLVEGVPAALSTAIARCLEKDRNARVADAATLAADLQRVLIGEARVTGQAALRERLATGGLLDAPPPPPKEQGVSFDEFLAARLEEEAAAVASASRREPSRGHTRTMSGRDLGRRYLLLLLVGAFAVAALILPPLSDEGPPGAALLQEDPGGEADPIVAEGARVGPLRGALGPVRRLERRTPEEALVAVGQEIRLAFAGVPARARVTLGTAPLPFAPGQPTTVRLSGPTPLQVDADGHAPFLTTVDPADGVEQTVRVPALDRYVRLRATPVAEVWEADGSRVGQTPLSLRVGRGQVRDLRLRAEGRVETPVKVGYDAAAEVAVTLPNRAQGRVAFRFFPANAKVYMDGRPLPVGTGNVVDLPLEAGEHRLVIRTPDGALMLDRRFSVLAEQTTNLGTLKEER